MSTSEPIAFVDLLRLQMPLRPALREAFERVLDHGRYVLGPEVEGFEAELSRYTGVAESIGVSSGTDALLATFLALDLEPGAEVLMTSCTFISTATSVMRAGLRPVFVDLAPGRFHPGAAEFEQAWTPRVRAVVIVHLFGEPVELASIVALCEQRGAVVVEDCAQAIGATFVDGTHVGSKGIAGTLSFFPAKNLGALGDGGAVLTDSEELANTVRQIRQHGCVVRYRHDRLGGNFRLDALQAALLGVLLGELDTWVARRRRNARWYQRRFESLAAEQPERIRLPVDADGHAWNQYVIYVADRERVRSRLGDHGIGNAVYYPIPLHRQPVLAPFRPSSPLEAADRHCDQALALPVYPGLRDDELSRVAEVVAAAVSC